MTDYYAGVLLFKQWQREHDQYNYDWADLSDKERAEWAKKEASA